MRTFFGRVDRLAIALALAAGVAGGFVLLAAGPTPRGYCGNGDPAVIVAALGSFYLAARALAWACRWLNETLERLWSPGLGPPGPGERDRFAEGQTTRP